MLTRSIQTPVGPLLLGEVEGAIASIRWGAAKDRAESPLLAQCERELEAYFAGELQQFDLPLAPAPDPFAARVRQALLAIPYGRTSTYGALASALASSPRVIGQAMGANPVPILVPCHRVLAAAGLGGFSGGGGIEAKRLLLVREGAILL